ncbi:MAG: hypothetical protein LBU32_30085 [Clostridiales bacterium]|nr:hypothetical protein [Clostridiales bacterium]
MDCGVASALVHFPENVYGWRSASLLRRREKFLRAAKLTLANSAASETLDLCRQDMESHEIEVFVYRFSSNVPFLKRSFIGVYMKSGIDEH